MDETGIYITGGSDHRDVLHFDFNGNYLGKAVDASRGPLVASFLGYDPVEKVWYTGNENRKVYSSTGGDWDYEFTWNNMGGWHGDGLEFVRAPDGTGYLYVSDMTSNYIGQWKKEPTGWTEVNRFEYVEIVGTAKDVEGMGFGALGHFWVTSAYWTGSSDYYYKGAYLYELGGGEIGGYTPPPTPTIPEPSTLLLFGPGLLGLGAYARARFGRRKK